MLLLKTSARGCIKSSSCWRLNDVKDFISVLAWGITQQLRLFGLWDFSSGGDEDVVFRPEGNLECCPHWISLQVSVNEIICFLSKDLRGRKKDFFFFLSNKVLCSKLIDKILVWLCTCFKSLPKNLVSEVVCNRLKYIKVYFCVKLF